ncbi:RraA family protein [Dyadobacter aurulentus]|uniref:RraA family protein n=1 Tax=Dyadobacter sp. UC 10 TaxID=2605428 RepID=UPI0011F2B637|nr:RraA family protein [Dyadobacter sp. UC 10]KAA0988817.1 RraA family protein [Dyadobacter sp. UC 10]
MLDFNSLKEELYVAVVADVLDAMGYTRQATRIPFHAFTGVEKLMGRCKTTLWADMFHKDANPYDLELKAVDSCQPGDVLIAAAQGSDRSGIFGELLATAASNSGCVGTIVHGAVRDIAKMKEMKFPVFATGRNPYDSQNRQRVIDIDIPVEMDGVIFHPGDIVFADVDGIVVIPQEIEERVIQAAKEKISAENRTRDAIKNGMKAMEAYQTFGVL